LLDHRHDTDDQWRSFPLIAVALSANAASEMIVSEGPYHAPAKSFLNARIEAKSLNTEDAHPV
jgi:hypothetical protein